MKKFVNKVENIVSEMVEGIVLSHSEFLARAPDTTVVFMRNFRDEQVALISGGGSGHEPAHAGFVGKGMLSSAVCGEVFTSPTPDMVLAAVKAVPSQKGALLIIKNYTGDVLNFQMAAELLNSEGIGTEYVVDDDVALENSTYTTGRRGIAGTILVHKIAGAKAISLASLSEVKRVALKAIANLASYGVSLDACTVPASGQKSFTLGANEVEIGLGIHGEPGVRRAAMLPADAFALQLLDATSQFLKLMRGDRVAVLINGLGATPLMELNIIARAILLELTRRGISYHPRVLVGNFLTSLDMPGFSLSLLKLDAELEALWDAPCQTSALVVNA